MTQYVINIGTFPNDGTGDPLRTAFNEVNLNFDQVFAAGPVGSNVQIANNTILTTNTNGNLVLAPNGIGVVQANVNIVPNTSNIRNLGSANRRWSTLYVQYANISGAITVSDLTATGNVTVGGNLSVTGNVINIGNIVTDAKTIQLANTAGTANAANGSGITVGANDAIATFLFNSANNTWATNIGLAVGGPITGTSLAVSDAIVYGNTTGINALFTGAVTTPNIVVNNISSDDSTFVTVQDGLDVQGDITAETLSLTGTVTTGNILPRANLTYSIGNSTLWWSNIWVAGNTIYIGGVPLGIAAGNVLTVNGNAVLQNDSNTTISTTGNITADYFFGDGSQLTGISGGITFEYDIGNFTANAIPAVGTMQFTNRDGDIVAPDAGTRLFINAVDGTGINTGSTWLAMSQNSERGTLTLQQDGAQTPYRVTNIGVYNTPEVYRGYRAGVNQIWGDDPSVNQIIISNAASPVFYNPDFNIEDDIFHATNLADATAVYMVNVYGSDDFTPLSQAELWNFFTSFVDNVIYQNTDTETQDVAEIRTAFYTNFANFYSSINSTKYDSEFRFASGTTYYSSAPATGGSGNNALLRVRLNANYTYTIMGIAVPGTGYQAADTIVIPGNQLNGATPANDLVATVDTVDGNGGITGVTLVSGAAAFPWRSNSISDGGDDQYDTGNYINTNLAQEILYQGGNVTAGTTQFGTDSEYAVMYNSSIFCMAATDVDITDLYYSGNLGADGDGFLRWSGLRSPDSAISVEYAYMRCEQGTGNLEPLPGETYQVALDSGGINLDQFYSYYDSVNWWYFGADRDWRLESRQQLNVQSYNTLTLRTLVPNEPTGLGSPEINISTDDGSDGNASVNLQAGSGGPITIQAGDAGSNNGVPNLGNNGGGISILAGDATGNNQFGGSITVAAGQGANGTAGNVTIRTRDGTVANGAIRLETNNVDSGKLWTLDATGNLTLPDGGNINEASGQTARFQALNEDGLAQAGVILNAGDGLTRLESFDSLTSSSYSNSDWTTGQYIENGGFGEINFTNAPTIVSFIATVNDARLFYQVNGGNLLPSSGWGTGGNNVTFYTDIPPASSPVTVDNFVIYYSYRSRIEMDYDEGELNIVARNLDLNIRGDQEVDIRSDDRLRLENTGNVNGVEITTDGANAFHTWNFNVNGSLTLPGGTAVIDSSDNNIELRSTNNINFETANVVSVYTSDGNYQWQFGDNGALTLASITTGEGTGESATVKGSRTVVGGFDAALPYVVELPGHTEFGNVVWTASSGTIQSAKITFVVQSSGSAFQWEQFDVSVCKFDGANAFVTVSNRIKQNSSIADTQVEAYDGEGSLAVWLNPADGQTIAWVNYQAVEFGLMVD